MDITLDIETIPPQQPDVYAEILAEEQRIAELEAQEIAPPGNYKNQDTIDKWWADTGFPKRDLILRTVTAAADEKYRKLALDGAYGQIAVIGYAIDDHDPVAVYEQNYAAPDSERKVLSAFYEQLLHSVPHGQIRIIGHNIIGFDLRYLFQRSVINRVRPPAFIPFNAKSWEQDKVFDTMVAWAGVGRTVSLDTLCKVLGLPSKPDDIDGSKVWDYVQSGRIEKVAAYCCEHDVVMTRECASRLQFIRQGDINCTDMDDVEFERFVHEHQQSENTR